MAVDAEKNDVQAVETADVHSDDGKKLAGEWQDVGSEQKMTWKTWLVIFVCFDVPPRRIEDADESRFCRPALASPFGMGCTWRL